MAMVRNRFVYASIKSEIAGNNNAGVVREISIKTNFSRARKRLACETDFYLRKPKCNMSGVDQYHGYLQGRHLRQVGIGDPDIIY